MAAGNPALAATLTWADTGSDFATGADWVGGVAPANSIVTDIASFGTVTNFQPNLLSARSVNGIAFTTTSVVTLTGATFTTGTGGINNSSTSGLKTVNNALILGAAQSFTNSGALNIAGPTLTNGGFLLTLTGTGASGSLSSDISGSGGITKTGSGTWIVSGNNSGYSGTTTVTTGTLQATNNTSALGTGALSLGGGTLSLANDTGLGFGRNTTLTASSAFVSDVLTSGNAGVTHTLGTLTQGTTTLSLTAGANVGSGIAGLTFGNTSLTGNATFNTGSGTLLTLGSLSDAAARTITKIGAGSLLLNSTAGSWTNGSSLVVNNGSVQLGASDALGSGATLTNVTVNANTAATTALFDLNGFNQTVLSLTFGGAGGTSTSTSNVSTGSGTLTLGGNVTLTNTGNPLGSTLSGLLDLGTASRTFNIGDSTNAPIDLTVSANIASSGGAYGLTKSGTGTLLLSGSNSYTGPTTVNAGTLRLGSSFSLPNSGVTVSSNTAGVTALLDLNGFNATVNSLTFGGSTATSTSNVSTGAGILTIGGDVTYANANNPLGSTLSGLLDLGTASRTFNIGDSTTAANDLTVSANIASSGGAYGLTKSGTGTLLLSGSNSYTGPTMVNAGTLRLGSSFSLPNSDVTVSSNTAGVTALLDLNGFNATVNSLTFGGSTATSTSNVSTGAGILTLGGDVTYANANNPLGSTLSGLLNLGTASRTFNIGDSTTAANDLTVSANISSSGGAYGLTKTGLGTLLLGGANTYTGATAINAGTLAIKSAGALGTASNTANTTVTNGAALQLLNNITTTNAGTLILNGTGVAGLGALQNLSGNNRWNSNVTLGSNTTLYSSTSGNTLYIGNATFGTSLFAMGGNTVTVDGPGNVWFDANVGVSGDTGGFIKNGTGKVTFYGYNTYYTGATFVNNGSLDLIVGPFSAGIYGINDALTIGDNIGSAATAVVNLASNSYANQISPASAITLNSDGVLNVGAGTGTGSLTFNGGQINISSGITLSPTGSITSNTNSAHQTSLISGGTLALGGAKTFTVDGDSSLASDLTVSSAITGGSITKQGTGILTLAGTNTLTGTTISAGTINAQATNALGTTGAVTVASGATLQLQGGYSFGQTSTTLNGTGTTGNGALENVSGNNTLTGPVTIASAARVQSDAGILTVSGTVALGANTLNVGGAGNTALNGPLTGSGTLTKDGSGTLNLSGNNAAFTGAVNVSAGTVIAQASSVFNSANVFTILSGAALNLNDYNIAVASINNAGTVNLGAGTANSLTLSSGTSFLQSGGLFSGAGTIIINSGATLTLNAAFNNSNINFILNGGTLNLNGSGGALDNIIGSLTINANSVLDFGSSVATSLTTNSVSFGTTLLTLTVNNWVNAVDYFYSLADPGGSQGNPPLTQFNFTGGGYSTTDNKWLPYDHQITPAPEPAVYGAVLTGFCTLLLVWRRRETLA